MNTTIAICITTTIVSICTVAVALILSKRKKRPNQTTVFSAIDHIRDLGDLVALTVHAKEIVTVKEADSRIVRGGKMAIICGFDIEYRFNLKLCEFKKTESENQIIMPLLHIKISTDQLKIYDEQKGKVAFLFPKDISTESKNQLIEKARAEAVKQATSLNQNWQERAQASARETLMLMVRGMQIQNPVVIFTESPQSEQQVIDGINQMVA